MLGLCNAFRDQDVDLAEFRLGLFIDAVRREQLTLNRCERELKEALPMFFSKDREKAVSQILVLLGNKSLALCYKKYLSSALSLFATDEHRFMIVRLLKFVMDRDFGNIFGQKEVKKALDICVLNNFPKRALEIKRSILILLCKKTYFQLSGVSLVQGKKDFFQWMEFLLQEGVSLNQKDLEGVPIVFYIIKFGAKDMLKFFMSHGADLFIEDSNGMTAFDIAVLSDKKPILKAMLNKGRKSKRKSKRKPDYVKMLDLAKNNNSSKVEKYLAGRFGGELKKENYRQDVLSKKDSNKNYVSKGSLENRSLNSSDILARPLANISNRRASLLKRKTSLTEDVAPGPKSPRNR